MELFVYDDLKLSFYQGKPGENLGEDGPTDYGASKPLEAIPGWFTYWLVQLLNIVNVARST